MNNTETKAEESAELAVELYGSGAYDGITDVIHLLQKSRLSDVEDMEQRMQIRDMYDLAYHKAVTMMEE